MDPLKFFHSLIQHPLSLAPPLASSCQPSSPTPAVSRPSPSSGKTSPTWFFGHLQHKRPATPLAANNHNQDLYKNTTPPTIHSQPRHQRIQKLFSSCPTRVSHSIQNCHTTKPSCLVKKSQLDFDQQASW
ncbi:hypothetical protein AVEN_128579-1 [Araneus ventricosus]|uniref:Uncharacterized protein n=1 Tax=Araneus ventricosus TaxID=182803 RepID=A0A4Y2TAP9_ARAVE|nr:hypothetical protein AVEN_128579-1 [Araneus ventricosus]